MSETGYTPRPWEVRNQHESSELMVVGADGRPVCSMRSWGEDEANARLISKAPDLVEALREIVGSMTEASKSGYTTVSISEAQALLAEIDGPK